MYKYWKIGKKIVVMSLYSDFMYPINAVIGNITSFVYTLINLLLVWIIFNAGGVEFIAGYRIQDFIFVFVLSQLVYSFYYLVMADNVMRTIKQINDGNLDVLLCKPVRSIFLVMFQRTNVRNLFNVIVLFAMIPIMVIYFGMIVTISDWISIVFVLIFSFLIIFFMYWVSVFCNFFWFNFNALFMFLNESRDVGKYPRQIYPKSFEWILVYVCPMLMIVNPVYKILDGSFFINDILLMIVLLIVFGSLMFLVWGYGLKRYNSAN